MKKLYQLAVIFFLWPPMVLAGSASPLELVRNTTEQIQSQLNETPELRTDPNKLNRLIEKTLLPHIDFDGLSRLTLGKHWRSASAEQRDRFTQEFRALLVRSYSSVLAGYANQQVEFLPSAEPADAKRATVNTRIVEAGRPPIAVDYRLRQIDNAWKIYDVSIEGVSLAINYRSTFAEEISTSGLDGLIADLKSSNAAGCVAKSASVAVQC